MFSGLPGLAPGFPGLAPGLLAGAGQCPPIDAMAILQMQQAQVQSAHLEMVNKALAEAAATGGPTPTFLPPGGLPPPTRRRGEDSTLGMPGMMGMASMLGMAGFVAGMPGLDEQQGASAPSSESEHSMEGKAKDFMKRNMLPPSFQEKLVRQLERKGSNWQAELNRLDQELVTAQIPPILRTQFLLVNFGDVVPQTWTDYEDAPKKLQGTANPVTVGSRSTRSPVPTRSTRSPVPTRASKTVRSRSRRRSRSRDKSRKDRSKDRRSRSRPKRSRSRSRKRDKER